MIFEVTIETRSVVTAASPTGPGTDHGHHIARTHVAVLHTYLETGVEVMSESKMPSASLKLEGMR